jgi:hypothetical protein
MANLDSLGHRSITECSTMENLELLRVLRENRRTKQPSESKKTYTSTRTKNKKSLDDLTPEQAARLLQTLLGGTQ